MRLPGIVGQPRAIEALTRGIASGRFHPSLILHGPRGAGKLTTALALARALVCRAEDPACGACASCRRIDGTSLRHPDVRVVLPERAEDLRRDGVAAEGVAGVDVLERQAAAERHPAWNVLIDRVREAIAFVQRRPSESERSVLIVDQAHRLGTEAGNALLKTLEEPPEHAVILLSTPIYHALLPTLRSRCQAIPFQTVPAAAIASWLAETHGLPRAEAALRAALAGGRPGAALELDLAAYKERRERLLRHLESFLRPPDPGQAVARAEEIAKGGESAEGDLEILASLLRDRMLVAAAGDDAPGLIHADLVPRLRSLPLHDAPDPTLPLAALEAAREGMRRKGNAQLLLECAFLDLLPPATRPPRPRV